MVLSFPTRKLKTSIIRINQRKKDTKLAPSISVFGVTNKDGITVTGKEVSVDTSNYIVVGGDTFVYNPYRINVGSIGLSESDFIGLVSPAYVVFKTKDDILNEFLYLYLKSTLGIQLIKWYGDRGGVRSALNFKDLGQIDFPDLTFDKQIKAYHQIKEKLKITDSLHTELEELQEKLAAFKQSILQDAIEGKLVEQDPNDEHAKILIERLINSRINNSNGTKLRGILDKNKYLINREFNIPKNWEWTVIDKIAQVSVGATPDRSNKNYWGGTHNWLSSGEVANNIIDHSTETISDEGLKNSSVKIYPKGTVLVAMIGQGKTRGQTAILDIEAGTNQNAAGLIIDNRFILSKYLWYFFLSRYNKTRLPARGGNQPALNGKIIGEISVPIPPFNEQKRIVDKVDSLLMLCDVLENNIKNAVLNINKMNEAILSETFKRVN